MILYNLKKNKNKKMPNAYGKYYAYPVVTQTIGMDGLATHMSGHNTPFSPGAIKGMLTDMAPVTEIQPFPSSSIWLPNCRTWARTLASSFLGTVLAAATMP